MKLDDTVGMIPSRLSREVEKKQWLEVIVDRLAYHGYQAAIRVEKSIWKVNQLRNWRRPLKSRRVPVPAAKAAEMGLACYCTQSTLLPTSTRSCSVWKAELAEMRSPYVGYATAQSAWLASGLIIDWTMPSRLQSQGPVIETSSRLQESIRHSQHCIGTVLRDIWTEITEKNSCHKSGICLTQKDHVLIIGNHMPIWRAVLSLPGQYKIAMCTINSCSHEARSVEYTVQKEEILGR